MKEAELANRDAIEKKRLNFARDSIDPQLASKQAEVDQVKAARAVKAGSGGSVARESRNERRAATDAGGCGTAGEGRRQSRARGRSDEIKSGDQNRRDAGERYSDWQKATIDTRNGVVTGHVTRVDPAVEQGTVKVDAQIDGELPQGARPDLTLMEQSSWSVWTM